jgi:hypothetical protein
MCGDLQAHLAIAPVAEQPPISTPASLLKVDEVQNSRATLPVSRDAAALGSIATLTVASAGRASRLALEVAALAWDDEEPSREAAPDCCIRPTLQKSGQGQERVVIATGDRDWCSAQSGSGSERRGDMVLAQRRKRGTQQAPLPHGSPSGAVVSARHAALSLPPRTSCGVSTGGVAAPWAKQSSAHRPRHGI